MWTLRISNDLHPPDSLSVSFEWYVGMNIIRCRAYFNGAAGVAKVRWSNLAWNQNVMVFLGMGPLTWTLWLCWISIAMEFHEKNQRKQIIYKNSRRRQHFWMPWRIEVVSKNCILTSRHGQQKVLLRPLRQITETCVSSSSLNMLPKTVANFVACQKTVTMMVWFSIALSRTLWSKVEIQLVLAGENQSTVTLWRWIFKELYNIRGALLWPMRVQIPIVVAFIAKPTFAIF